MRILFLAALAASATTMVAATPAFARDGCGNGAHRVGRGRCVPNRVGNFYRGHGYWDGHRYYQHRERDRRHHGGWRYR